MTVSPEALMVSSNPAKKGRFEAVAFTERWPERRARWLNRFHARRAGWGPVVQGFVTTPEPRSMGSFHRGRQLASGNFLFAGYLVEAPETPIWDLPMPDPVFEAEVHGFAWLDDLAAVGDRAARQRAQAWTHDWIARHGRGEGPGWTPDLAGRRMVRWINHAILLLNGASRDENVAFFRALTRQTRFLARRWHAASPGLPRFEALTGLVYAGLSLTGMQRHIRPAVQGLDRECRAQIGADGGIPTRSPEDLLEVFTLLTWSIAAMAEEGRTPGPALLNSIERIAPTLRALRHADGGLARFHGGGRGLEGRLDQALATSGVKTIRTEGLAMGFVRISHGRTSIILDAAPPPLGPASANAHASTLAMEITSGRRPLIVNCGSGRSFGQTWRRAGRATASHSTLALEGYSSARLAPAGSEMGRARELLADGPRRVTVTREGDDGTTGVSATHDGYLKSHGIIHARSLRLSLDGRGVTGEDAIVVPDAEAGRVFDRARKATRGLGLGFAIRFHIHPDVHAALDLGGNAVSLELRSGELWLFRHDGQAVLSLEPSVFLEKGRLAPRASRQIVLSGRAIDQSTRVGWTISKAQDTPTNIRDFASDSAGDDGVDD
jgi:uncharacterized heparinase superfamily protein